MLLINYQKVSKQSRLQKILKFTIIENKDRKIYGVQFHPEVTHTENGMQIFKNFLFNICKVKKMENLFRKK